jgi:hypothetical protein
MSYSQGGVKPGKPPSFASQYTLDEWLALISGDLDYWAQQTGKPPLAINGLRAPTLASLSPRIGMMENAWRSQGGVLPDADQWVATMDTLAQAQQQQWVPWAFVKLFDMSASLWDRWRRMAAPSALIADAGSFLLGFGGSEGSPPAWVTNEHRQVCWTPNIGKPTSAPWPINASADGTYRRAFEQGLVVYNPGTNGVSVSRASGARTFPVGPQEGIILRHTAQGWVLVA